MTDEQLAKAAGTILHIPTVLGAVVVTYNVPGVPSRLKLTPEALADIFLGKITKWNDPTIAAPNPGVKLPAHDIVVVHRSDGSGTTVHLHRLPLQGEPGLDDKVGTRHRGAAGRSASAARATRA